MMNSITNFSLTALLILFAPGVSGSSLRGEYDADDGPLFKQDATSQKEIEGILEEIVNQKLMERNKELLDKIDLQQKQYKELIKDMMGEMVQLADQNKDLIDRNKELMKRDKEAMEHNKQLMNERHLQAQASGEVFARRVFLTSAIYRTSHFDGLSGADDKCQKLANAANLGGIYKAWLSDSTASPSTRFYKSPGPYVLVNGTVIADSWTDLIDGGIKAPINVDETGKFDPASYTPYVYTGTKTDGTADPSLTCSDWSGSDPNASQRTGRSFKSDQQWTGASVRGCHSLQHLYCFEQHPTSS